MEYIYYMTKNNADEIPKNGVIDYEFYNELCNINGYIDGYGILYIDHELTVKELNQYSLYADENNFTLLYDKYGHNDIEYTDDGDNLIIDGKEYIIEMCLSQFMPDNVCCRVLIDGKYYYFG